MQCATLTHDAVCVLGNAVAELVDVVVCECRLRGGWLGCGL